MVLAVVVLVPKGVVGFAGSGVDETVVGEEVEEAVVEAEDPVVTVEEVAEEVEGPAVALEPTATKESS